MMGYSLWTLLFIGSFATTLALNHPMNTTMNVVCYFPEWGEGRTSPWNFPASRVNPALCTHIIWSFVPVNVGKVTDPYWRGNEQLKYFTDDLQKQNPDLKILAAVGGANLHGFFEEVVKSPQQIDDFADSVAVFVEKYKLDGIDIDWEFPKEEHADGFTQLLQAVRTALDSVNRTEPLLLSAALGPAENTFRKAYQMKNISGLLDIANLMLYDLHGSWDGFTAMHSSLYPDDPTNPVFSDDWILNQYLSLGLDPSKAHLGVPFYGRSYTLCPGEQADVLYSNTCGKGNGGPYTQEPGILAYYEICEPMQRNYPEGMWQTVFHNISRVPYSFKDDQFVSHENIQSISEKVEYAIDKQLGGMMIWDISQDDFNDACGDGPNPLLATIASVSGLYRPENVMTSTETTYIDEYNATTHAMPPELDLITTMSTSNTTSNQNQNETRPMNVVCYFPEWGEGRSSPWNFPASHVDPALCTHVIWSFVLIAWGRIKEPNWRGKEQLKYFTNLRKQNPHLKILVSVGGATLHGVFEEIVKIPHQIENFADSVAVFVDNYNLDGIDIDWEFPQEEHADGFTKLLQAVRTALDSVNHTEPLLLSAALGPAEDTIKKAYQMEEISRLLDIANLMLYDLHGSWDGFTGMHSSLYPDNPNHPVFSDDWILSQFLSLGLDPLKAHLGVPFYGRSYTLCPGAEADLLYSDTCDKGSPGTHTGEAGILAYFEICEALQQNYTDGMWQTVFHNISRVPYSFKGNQWVSYENIQSITEKVEYAIDKQLGGMMIWDISQDDFNDACGDGANPLLATIASVSGLYRPENVTTTPPRSTLTPHLGDPWELDAGDIHLADNLLLFVSLVMNVIFCVIFL